MRIVGDRGKHFDPYVVDAFLDAEGQFVSIKKHFADEACDESAPNSSRMTTSLRSRAMIAASR